MVVALTDPDSHSAEQEESAPAFRVSPGTLLLTTCGAKVNDRSTQSAVAAFDSVLLRFVIKEFPSCRKLLTCETPSLRRFLLTKGKENAQNQRP